MGIVVGAESHPDESMKLVHLQPGPDVDHGEQSLLKIMICKKVNSYSSVIDFAQ